MLVEQTVPLSESQRGTASAILAGTILVKSGTRMPDCLQPRSEGYGSWKKLQVSSHAIEVAALRSGWRFSYIVPGVVSRGFGLTRLSATHAAIEKIMDAVSKSGFNSLEISALEEHRILGSYFVTVHANPRHLRPSPFFRTPDPRHYPYHVEDFAKIFWRAVEVEPQAKGI